MIVPRLFRRQFFTHTVMPPTQPSNFQWTVTWDVTSILQAQFFYPTMCILTIHHLQVSTDSQSQHNHLRGHCIETKQFTWRIILCPNNKFGNVNNFRQKSGQTEKTRGTYGESLSARSAW